MQKFRLSTFGTIALAVGIIGILVTPYLLTRGFTPISFANTGQIGDTIGGLTAPVIGLVSAVLVYLALLSQVRANEIIQEQINTQKQAEEQQKTFDSLHSILRQVVADLDSLSIVHGQSLGISAGISRAFVEATELHCSQQDKTAYQYRSELIWIQDALKAFKALTARSIGANMNKPDWDTFVALVDHAYQSRIKSLLPTDCSRCSQGHALFPEEFCNLLDALEQDIERLKSTAETTDQA